MITNINNYALPYSLIVSNSDIKTDSDGIIYSTKRKYSNIITVQRISGLFSRQIRKNVKLFDIAGECDYFNSNNFTQIGCLNINKSVDGDLYYLKNVHSWDSQDSNYTEQPVLPAEGGCVFCIRDRDLMGGKFNFIGVYNSYIYYMISNINQNMILKCHKIDEINPKWSINVEYDDFRNRQKFFVTDETGIYIYYQDNNKLVKYAFDDGNKLWEYNMSNVKGVYIIKNKGIVIYNDTNISLLNKNGGLIKNYATGLGTSNVFVDYVNGYILLYNEIDKVNGGKIVILDSNGSVLLNLSITSSSTLWSRISGNYITKMAINKNKELWILNYSDTTGDEVYYLTKVSITSSNIGTRQFQINVPKSYAYLPSYYIQDERTGGMYIMTTGNSRLMKHENLNNTGKQLFSIPYVMTSCHFDLENPGMIYYSQNNSVKMIRDNSYGKNYYKSVLI